MGTAVSRRTMVSSYTPVKLHVASLEPITRDNDCTAHQY